MLQVRVNLLGQRVYCQHCGGGFVAMDEQMRPAAATDEQTVANRADELLEQAALLLQQADDAGFAG